MLAPEPAEVAPARGGSLVLGGVATVANVVIQAVAQLAVIVFAARRLDAGDLGVYVAGVTVVMLAVAVESAVSLGVVPVASRAAAPGAEPTQNAEAIAGLHRLQVLLLRWSAVAGAAGALVAAVAAATADNVVGRTVLVLQLTAAVVVYLAGGVVRGVLQGQERFAYFSGANMLGQLVNVAVSISLVGRYGLAALGMGQLLAALVSRGLAVWGLRGQLAASRRARGTFHGPPRRWLPTVGPLLLAVAGGQLVAVMSATTIGFVVDADSAGLFRVAAQLPAQLMALIYQVTDMLLPRISRQLDVTGGEHTERRLAREAGLCAAAALAVLCLHRDTVMRLVLDAEPGDGGTVVAVSAVLWLVNVPAHVAVLRLVALDAFRLVWPVIVGESLLAGVLLVVGVPVAGIVGGAVAVTAAAVLSNAVALPWRCRSVLPIARFTGYARSAGLGAVEGVLAAAVAWLAIRPIGGEAAAMVAHGLLAGGLSAAVVALRVSGRVAASRGVVG